ncbi:MAG: histidine phosphatase family protein [Spirochaetales bacterium]|nr:histidine phosphatase family protein [Spirochaetales bacterium]
MNHLFFIRHGESEANRQKILGSQLAYCLTDEGKADAALIAEELYEVHRINRIISSPLLRTLQTAQPFAEKFGLEIETDDRFKEQHFGSFSGMYYEEAKAEPDFEMDYTKRWDWRPKGGGESYEDISIRLIDFFALIEKKPLDGNTLIVTHAVTLRIVQALLENTLPDYPEAFQNNGEIQIVDFKRLGESHHMESIMLGNSADFVLNPKT